MILWRLHLAAARTIDMCMRRLVDDTKKLTWRGYSAFRPAVELCFSFPSAQNISTLTSRHHFTMDLGMKAKIRASIRSRHFSSHHSRVITAVDGFALYGRPHDEKAIGHDSYFIAETKNFTALGVADGVTQWMFSGINPAKFSVSLMENCYHSAIRGVSSPLSILQEAYLTLQAVRPKIIGSSTACLAVIEDNMLRTANLGDSGFIVIRQSSIIHASSPQQHFLNCPYQLTISPDEDYDQCVHDSPDMADLASIRLENRDVILLGTDGLFENLDQEHILDNFARVKDINEKSLHTFLRSLVDDSRGMSYEVDELSPFAREASRLYFQRYKGGRPDDITAVVAAIV